MSPLPYDYEGEDWKPAKVGDGDIIGPAGQTVRKTSAPKSEQIAAWGGFRNAEVEVNETEDRAVPVRSLAGSAE